MKLDNKELFIQRTKLLNDIAELLGHVEALKEYADEYVQSLKHMPGIFFRVKGIVYVLTNKNSKVSNTAGTMSLVDELPSVLFKALDNKSIAYYKTVEGRVAALDMFRDYIIDNMHIILHELVHIDDRQNGIIEKDDKSVNTNPYVYYNHPSEIRAYTQQCLYLAISEILEAINENKIKNKKDLKKFCKIYKDYKDIFTKAKQKNNFVYWTTATFNDYLDNLDYVVNLLGLGLPD